MNALFWTIVLAAVAMAWSLLWAGSRRAAPLPAADRTNVALLDERLAALDAERAAGAIDAERHGEAVAELQHRLLAESRPPLRPPTPASASPRLLAALAIALPAFVAGGYLLLGNPAGLGVARPVATATDDVSPEAMRQMVDALSRQLQSRPAGHAEDLPGWLMLARSQAALRRFGEAASAYERAVALAPNDAQLLADFADVLTALHAAPASPPAADDDRAAALIDRALVLDPRNLKALALAGNAAAKAGRPSVAVDFWRRARALAPPESEFAKGMDQNLADAGAPADERLREGDAAPASAGRRLVGDVRLDPALAGRVGPGDTLFVFARAEHGPRMPLAIVRRPASALSEPFTLDDSTAMAPELRLSNFDAVVVGARISRSGDAAPQPGDLVGEVRADAASRRLTIVIDRVQP